MTIEIPNPVKKLLSEANRNNQEIYIYGDCLLDTLLGEKSQYWQLATEHSLEDLINVSLKNYICITDSVSNTVKITINHITILISCNTKPCDVIVNQHITVCSLFYSIKSGIIDTYNGLEDIKDKKVHFFNVSNNTFELYPKLILDAFIISAKYNFRIDDDTLKMLIHVSPALADLNINVKREALNAILLSKYCLRALRKMLKFGFFKYIIPELEQTVGFELDHSFHDKTLDKHILYSIGLAPENLLLRLALLLHDIGKVNLSNNDNIQKLHAIESYKMAYKILHRLGYDEDTISRVCRVILYHNKTLLPKRSNIIKWVNIFGKADIKLFINMKAANINSQNSDFIYRLNEIADIEKMLESILNEKQFKKHLRLEISEIDLINKGKTLFEAIDIIEELAERNNEE